MTFPVTQALHKSDIELTKDTHISPWQQGAYRPWKVLEFQWCAWKVLNFKFCIENGDFSWKSA